MYSSNCCILEEDDGFDVRASEDNTYIHVKQGMVTPLLISCEERQLIELHDKIEETLWDISEQRAILSDRVAKQEALIDMLRDKIDELESEVLAIDYDNLTSPSGE